MDISHCTSRAASARRDSRRPLARQRAEGTDHSVPSAVSVTTLDARYTALSCCTSRGAQTSKGKARTRITLDTACSTEQDIVDRTAHTTSTIDETWIQKSTYQYKTATLLWLYYSYTCRHSHSSAGAEGVWLERAVRSCRDMPG